MKIAEFTEFHPYWLPLPPRELDLDLDTKDFILNCYNRSDGGYGNYPTEGQSFINPTIKAIICLLLLGNPKEIKRNEVYSFIRGAQNRDGGFAITTTSDLYPSNLESTFYSIVGLNLIGYLPRLQLHLKETISWVSSHYNIDGGFHGDESVISNEYYTFLALSVLLILKKIENLDINLTNSYLIGNQIKKNPEVAITTSRLNALYILEGLDRLNLKISKSRLARCQNKNGGFRNKKIILLYKSDMLSTFYSINGLKIINKLGKIKKSEAIKWIMDSKNDDGGFGSKPHTESSLSNTFNALVSLYYLIA